MLNGLAVLIYGPPAVGKTTVGAILKSELQKMGESVFLMDGDAFRSSLNADLSFSRVDRIKNIVRLGQIAIEFASQGGISIITAIAPYLESRVAVKVMAHDKSIPFYSFYLTAPLEILLKRDGERGKSLYQDALRPEGDPKRKFVTGVNDPFEEGGESGRIDTSLKSPEETVEDLIWAMD